MSEMGEAFAMIVAGDAALFAVVRLSLIVSLSAVLLASLVAFPLGAAIALTRFPGRGAVIVILNGRGRSGTPASSSRRWR